MEEEKKENVNEIIKEVEEELVKEEGAEKTTLETKEETSTPEEVDQKQKKQKNTTNYVLIVILVLFAIILGVLDYPKVVKLLKNQKGSYSFDYNFNKVRSFDWDTMITEKKVAKALNVPLQKINSAKNPDYSWVLEEPEQFVNEVKCAALIDEKILNEADENVKNLFNINVTICKDKAETLKTFTDRKDETKNIATSDSSVEIKELKDVKNIGDDGYSYIIEKKGTTDPTNPSKVGTASEKFGGISFIRGPFIVMIDESEKTGMATLSTEENRNKLASYIDNQLKAVLVWY